MPGRLSILFSRCGATLARTAAGRSSSSIPRPPIRRTASSTRRRSSPEAAASSTSSEIARSYPASPLRAARFSVVVIVAGLARPAARVAGDGDGRTSDRIRLEDTAARTGCSASTIRMRMGSPSAGSDRPTPSWLHTAARSSLGSASPAKVEVLVEPVASTADARTTATPAESLRLLPSGDRSSVGSLIRLLSRCQGGHHGGDEIVEAAPPGVTRLIRAGQEPVAASKPPAGRATPAHGAPRHGTDT